MDVFLNDKDNRRENVGKGTCRSKREETAVGIQNYQGGLHPAFAEYSGEKTLSDLLFSPLTRIAQDGSIDYVLAEDIKQTASCTLIYLYSSLPKT